MPLKYFLTVPLFFIFFQSSAIIRIVENLNDDGEGSLREAIAMTANGDTIQFEVTGTIVLSSGELDIYTDILIDGPGMDLLTLNPLGVSRAINIEDASAHIRGLTINQANPYGIIVGNPDNTFILEDVRIEDCENESSRAAGLYVAQSMTCELINCEFLGNDADGDGITYVYGGGAYISSTMDAIVSGCLFDGNTVRSINGGGTGSQSHAYGGGLYVNSPNTQVYNSTFTNNSCTAAGCCGSSPNWARAKGGGLYCNNGTVTLDGVNASSNSLSTNDYVNYELKQGMGCFITNTDSVFVRNSEFRSNTAGYNGQYVNVYGGALYAYIDTYVELDNVTAAQNSGQSVGGVTLEAVNGMDNYAIINELRCDSNSVSNSTPEKAGLFLKNFDLAQVSNSRFAGNSDRGVSTEDVESLQLLSNFFDENTGHVQHESPSGSTHLIQNNTFARSDYYAFFLDHTNGSTLANNTFVDNSGDMYLWDASVTMKNNIMSYTTFLADSYNEDGTVLVISEGGNVSKDDSWEIWLTEPTDIHNSDPQLTEAADNGGPTWTCAIPSNSSAVDIEMGGGLATDQRGFLRDGDVDAGAFEFGAADPLSITFDGISEDVIVCEGDVIMLEADFTSGTSLTYQWFFGDDEIEGETENILIIDPVSFGDAGMYKCEASNDGNSATSTNVEVQVYGLPEVTISGNLEVCNGSETILTASGAVAYEWNNDLGVMEDANVLVEENMTVEVMGTDANGCINSASVDLLVLELPEVQTSDDQEICAGSEVTISASGGEGYFWDNELGDGAAQNVTPEETTTYTVTVTGENDCVAQGMVTIEVLPEPEFDLTEDMSVCEGDSVFLEAGGEGLFFLWADFGGGLSFWDTPESDYTYYVYALDENNCGKTDSVVVTLLLAPPVDAGLDVTLCLGDTTVLMASGAEAYEWDNGLGIGNDFEVSPEETTVYSVITQGENGCFGSDEVMIEVAPLPEVDAGADVIVCQGEEVILSGSGADTYEWDGGVEDGVAFEPNETMDYHVIGTDANGCTGGDDVLVEVVSAPEPLIFENNLELSTTPYDSYQWYWNGLPIDGATDQIYVADANGSYTVVVTDDNGCEGESDAFIINDVSIGEETSPLFLVYPNPVATGGQLFISSDELASGMNLVALHDMQGRIIWSKQLAKTGNLISVPTEGLSSGVYAIQILDMVIRVVVK